MVKVCHMTSVHSNNDIRIFHKECVSLAKAGFEVYLVAQGDSFVSNGVNIVGVPVNKGNRMSRMIKTAREVHKRALEIDAEIYHFHDPELLPYGLKLSNIGKKVIFDSHEFYMMQIAEKYYLPKWLRNMIAKLYVVYENHVLKNIDAVVFPCTYRGQDPFNKRSNKTVFISNVPILSEFNLNNENRILNKNNTVCYVGGITQNRGFTNIIKAVYSSEANLVLCGKFSPETYKKEMELLVEYQCVDYRGYLDRNGIAKVLGESNIGICTNLEVGQYGKFDTFGTKVYEYWAAGLPVIVTDRPFVREFFKKYDAGICVDPQNIEEIANAIKYLSQNPEIAKKMGEEGRKAVLEKFSWEVEEKKLLKLYDELSGISA